MPALKRRSLILWLLPAMLAAATLLGPAVREAFSAVYYWDSNGTAAGGGATSSGTWGTSSFWNTDSAGGNGTFTATSGSADNLNFVAGPGSSSGENAYTVTVAGNQNAYSLAFQSSGAALLSGTGSVNLSGGGIMVNQYAYGSVSQGTATIASQINLQAPQTWTNNAGNPFVVSGNVNNSTNSLTIGGSGNTIISGILGTGSGGLLKTGGGTLTLGGANTFSGTTSISGGTLKLSNGLALQNSTLVATNSGSIAFDSSVSPASFTLGALTGSGNLSLKNIAGLAVSLTMGGNNSSTSYSGVISGSGSLATAGNGILSLMGSVACSSFSEGAGGVLLAGTGSLTTTNTGGVYLGTTSPAAMTIQDSGSVTAGILNVNYQNTSGGPSSLTITGGSLHVIGQTYVGRANMGGGPSNTSAAVYQSGGTASLGGLTSVGYNGTALSLYDINGGILNANGGMMVGGNPTIGINGQGNGVVNIQGSAIVNVFGGNGLQIGEDSTLATSGSVSLSSGTLSIKGNIILGGDGGIGTFYRGGGVVSASGGLTADGTSMLILDSTVANVATIFNGALSHNGLGTLVVVPQTGNPTTSESIGFTQAPTLTNGILGPWAVMTASGSDSSGYYLTTTGTGTKYLAAASSVGFSGSGYTAVIAATSSTTLAGSASAYVVNFGNHATTIGSQLMITSGGLILNGGTVSGGVLSITTSGYLAVPAMIYAGSDTPGTIASAIRTSAGLVKFGPGTLVLSGSNGSLSGAISLNSGVIDVENNSALGSPADTTTVAVGASLQIQGSTLTLSQPLVLNGTGINGSGALCNLSGNNTLTGNIKLNSDAEVNASAGTLTMSGIISSVANLTKTGSGTLILAGNSGTQLSGEVIVADGTLLVTNSGALGGTIIPSSTTVQNGASLDLQGGLTLPSLVPLSIGGVGVSGSGALHVLAGGASITSPITLTADSQVNIDSAADTLALSGIVGGGFALTKGGSGTLALSGSNSFAGALNILSGTLSVANANATGSPGPLGEGAAPVVLGSNAAPATLFYTGSSATTNRPFTLGTGGGIFSVAGSLSLTGVIGGNGSLTQTGSGSLTLGGGDLYTGVTTISAGTLAVSSSGSINASTGLAIAQGCLLQVSAGSSGNQLPNSGNVILSGGMLSDAGSGAFTESVGALLLNPGQSQVVFSNSGTGTASLSFASGTPHTIGATIGFASTGSQIAFLANPPALANGILPYAYCGAVNSTSADFATLSTSGGMTLVSAITYSNSNVGNISSMTSNGTVNVATSGSLSTMSTAREFNSLKLAGNTSLSMTGTGNLTLDSGGLLSSGSANTINGSSIWAPNGEMIIDTAAPLTISSVISTTAALTKTGPATLTLSGTYPIVGNTFINQGTLTYAPTGNLNYSGVISGAGNLVMSGTGEILTLSGTSPLTGSASVTAGTLAINGSLTGGGGVNLQSGGVLSGSGSILGNATATGGTVSQSASGSISGSMNVASGTLTVGQAGSAGYLNAGSINISGSGALTAAGTSATLSGNLIYTSSSNSTFGGVIGRASTVTLDAPAATALTFSSSNSYSGGTLLEAGTLKASNSAALGNGEVTINGGTLDIGALSNLEVTSLGGTGGFISKSASGTGTLTISPSSGVTTEYSGKITNGSGIVALTLPSSAAGTLILAGTNSYTGGTSVDGGTLWLASNFAMPSGSSLTIGADGTLVFDSSSADAGEAESAGVVVGGPVTLSAVNSSVTAVPEPQSIALLLAGLVFCVCSLVFRRKPGLRTGERLVKAAG